MKHLIVIVLAAGWMLVGCAAPIGDAQITPELRVVNVLIQEDHREYWRDVRWNRVDRPPAPEEGMVALNQHMRYPAEARRRNVQGTAVVAATIGADGLVQDARVLRGPGAGIDEEALRVVRATRFEPGIYEGEPAAMQAQITLRFRTRG